MNVSTSLFISLFTSFRKQQRAGLNGGRSYRRLLFSQLMCSLFALLGLPISSGHAVSLPINQPTSITDSPFELKNNWAVKLGWVDIENFDSELSDGWKFIDLPFQIASLGNSENLETLNGMGQLTYATTVKIPPKDDPTQLALYVGQLTASKIYIIGPEGVEHNISRGTIGVNRETEDSLYGETIVPISINTREFKIVIHQSNYSQARAGLFYPPKIGTHQDLLEAKLLSFIISSALAGLLLIMSIYHIILYLQRAEDSTPLWFAGITVVIAIRELIMGKALATAGIGNDAEVMFRIEYATIPLGTMLLRPYILTLFNHQNPFDTATRISLLAAGGLTVFAFSSNLFTVMENLYIFQIYGILSGLIVPSLIVYKELRRKNLIAKWFTITFGILSLTVINDVLYTYNILVFTTYLIPIGFVSFIMSQAFLISHKFASAFQERDENQRKLLSAYQELDEELLKREALVAANEKLEADIDIASQQLVRADKLATLGTVVAGVAHDIASPAGLILGARELIGENRDALHDALTQVFQDDHSPEARELFEHLEGKLSAIDTGTAEIGLGIGRINAIQSAIRNQSRQDVEMSSFELRPVVEECLVILNTKLKSIKISLDIDPTLTMTGRRSQIGQALTNLLSNAADAVLEVFQDDHSFEPEISISAGSADDAGIVFSVEDNGPGIPAEHREKVKQAFFTTKAVGKGTGLGMPIVLKILEAHEMSLDILTSERLGGAKMHIAALSTGGELS